MLIQIKIIFSSMNHIINMRRGNLWECLFQEISTELEGTVFPGPLDALFFPEKCDLNSTCVLCAEGMYYFQTYKYPYIFHMKKVTH